MREFQVNEFSLEVWPGVVRIHQGGEMDEHAQVVEITCDQLEHFISLLRKTADVASALGLEFAEKEKENRISGTACRSLLAGSAKETNSPET